MIAWLLTWARQHGYRWCDLGMAPPASSERPELVPFWRRLLKTAPGFAEGRPTIRTLREDRQRFDPVWEPRYLVYPGGAALGGVLADVTALIERPSLPPPDKRHLRRQHGHELHVRVERQARHVEHRADDVRDVEARFRTDLAVGLQRADGEPIGHLGRRVADVDLAAGDVPRAGRRARSSSSAR